MPERYNTKLLISQGGLLYTFPLNKLKEKPSSDFDNSAPLRLEKELYLNLGRYTVAGLFGGIKGCG